MPKTSLPKSIFRAYDIRGIYKKELNDNVAESIGKAYGTYLIRKLKNVSKISVVVGNDSRKSSPILKKAFIKGVISTGCDVTDIGKSLTPIIHFLTCVSEFDGGVEVTASHNPRQYNGFRLDFAKAKSFLTEDISNLYTLIKNEDFIFVAPSDYGKITRKDLFEHYLNFLKKQFSFKKDLKVIIDCGYGTTSYFVEKIFSELGANVQTVFCRPNNDFPLGVPNPEKKEFMKILQGAVLTNKADIGFAFDEDSDRFGVVDEKGTLYNNDMAILFFAKYLLTKNVGGKVLFDVKSSELISDLVTKWGGEPKMLKTGHTYFSEEMQIGAILGGEFSGHMYFGDRYFGYDDGIYAACRMIELLSALDITLSEIMEGFPKRVSSSEIKVLCSENEKFEIVKSVTSKIVGKATEFKDIVTIDGVRVKVSKTGWFLIRASNTSPYLSIRAEGETEEELKLILQGVSDLLKPYSLDLSPLSKRR